MHNAINTATNLIEKLNQIQHAVGVAGMSTESALLLEVKEDLATLVARVPPEPTVVRRIIDAGFKDVLSSMDQFLVTISALTGFKRDTWRDSPEFETLLHQAALSAEVFSGRCAHFLESKRELEVVFGGDDNGN